MIPINSIPGNRMSTINRRSLAFVHKTPVLYNFLTTLRAQYWTPEAINLSKEKTTFRKLDPLTQTAVFDINAFFGTSDGYVIKNIQDNFFKDLEQFPEVSQVLLSIAANELIHSETYKNVIASICEKESDFEDFIDSSIKYDAIRDIHDWIEKYMNTNTHYLERCLAFVALEGLIFSSCFAYIHNLKAQIRNDSMQGLIDSNEYIAKDEGVHTDFGITLYRLFTTPGTEYFLYDRLPEETVKKIFTEAVDLADKFIHWYMSGVDHQTIKISELQDYVKHIANEIVGEESGLGYGKMYDVKNPFEWMFSLGLSAKTNFFEKHDANYRKDIKSQIDWDSPLSNY